MSKHTGGPNRTPGKANLIHGTELRCCIRCQAQVFVPQASSWEVCTPCRKGWRAPCHRDMPSSD